MKPDAPGSFSTFAEIHAPLFRPVEITELKIIGAGLDADHLEFDAGRIEAGLSFAGFFGGSERSHLLSSLRLSTQNCSSVAVRHSRLVPLIGSRWPDFCRSVSRSLPINSGSSNRFLC